jgi:hypothetical protein
MREMNSGSKLATAQHVCGYLCSGLCNCSAGTESNIIRFCFKGKTSCSLSVASRSEVSTYASFLCYFVFFSLFAMLMVSCRSWFRDLEKKRCEISMDLIDAIARHVYVLLFPA